MKVGILLNLGSQHSVRFTAEEVAQLASEFPRPLEKLPLAAGSKIVFMKPYLAKVPALLISTMKGYLARNSIIEDIYLSMWLVSTSAPGLSYVLAFKFKESIHEERRLEVFRDVSQVMNGVKPDHPVDVILANEANRNTSISLSAI